ncbi:12199_t:CDS:2 [Funneliformis mosseae]|uniref:12199_t:CDS:1 n=1 Tax=Funneliformis mosseae TaxID=27381 RepID=A0A9N9NF09_FUNMO|nr:12199_t:CDS:2 [Funneliformis mosseae]
MDVHEDETLVDKLEKNCSYFDKPFEELLWCKECDPLRMIEGWTSGNSDIDIFIKDTIFTDIKEIGEGGFAKVYFATWIDGQSEFRKQDDGSWKKSNPKPMKVALKRLNGSREMSAKYFNEVAPDGNLRSYLSDNFNNILWKDKIKRLYDVICDLYNLHSLGFCHKNLHNGNILQDSDASYISDFGLSGAI